MTSVTRHAISCCDNRSPAVATSAPDVMPTALRSAAYRTSHHAVRRVTPLCPSRSPTASAKPGNTNITVAQADSPKKVAWSPPRAWAQYGHAPDVDDDTFSDHQALRVVVAPKLFGTVEKCAACTSLRQ